MISTHQIRKNKIGILISPGFAESQVVYCLTQMRTAGLPVSLVGLSNKLIHSQHGLVVRPDYSLNQLTNSAHFRLLIIPGNYECVVNLLTSPDFHSQIKANISQNGFIAIFNEATAALQQAQLFTEPSEHILRQNEHTLAAFCQLLIQLISSN